MLKPKLFQLEAVKRSIDFLLYGAGNAAYNGSDPGVGKTIMTLLTIPEMGFKKILVISPKNMLYTWKKEANIWLPDFHVDILETPNDKLKLHAQHAKHIYVVAYSFVWRDSIAKYILKNKWDCLVLDEAHKLQNKKAEQTRFVLTELWKRIPYRIALSGTPFGACVTECYAIFNKMLPNFFGGKYAFAEAFAIEEKTPWGSKFHGIKNAEILSKLIRKNFFFRYKRDEVENEIPARNFTQITLPKKYSLKAYEDMLKLLEAEGTDVTELPDIPVHMMGVIRLQGELKVDVIAEYAEDLLEQNIPIVIFTINKAVLAAYKERLAKFNPLIIDGDTSTMQREINKNEFQTGVSNLMLINFKAGGEGITLTRAQYVLLSQLPFNPRDVEQAVSRANRIGAKETLNISYFVVENSLDEKISSRIMQKLKDFNKLFNEAA